MSLTETTMRVCGIHKSTHPHPQHPHIHNTRYMYRNIWISLLQAYAAGLTGRRTALQLYRYLGPLKRGAVRTTHAGRVLPRRWLSVACAGSAIKYLQIDCKVGGTWGNNQRRPFMLGGRGWLMGSSKSAISKSRTACKPCRFHGKALLHGVPRK